MCELTRKEIEKRVTEYLANTGMKRSLFGFAYLRTALILCIEDFKNVHHMMYLYEKVANEHFTTRSKAERSIRHAIETIHFGQKAPINSHYIAEVADALRLELED